MSELKTPPIAARLRASVLQQAIQGRLVPQDSADEPASDLMKDIYLDSDGSWYERQAKGKLVCIDDDIPFDLPESWCWARMSSLCAFGSCVNIEYSDVPVDTWNLDLEDLEKDTGRILQKKRKGEKDTGSTKHVFKAGMVLYSKLRPYLNKVTVADENGVCTSEILPLTFEHLTSEFAVRFFMSPYFLDFANRHTSGIKMPRLRVADAKSMLVPVPPLAEQRRIVERINEVMPLIDQLEIKERESDSVDTTFWRMLPQSILQQAVEGKLVPQDADDEPACALLERIREERAELVKQKKAKAPKGGESRIYQGADGSWYEQRGKTASVCIDEEIPFDIPESWEWARLNSIVNIVSARRVHKNDWRSSGVPFYRAREIVKLAKNEPLADPIFIDESLYSELSQSGIPLPGDLMVTGIGTIGTTYVVQPDDKFYYKDASVLCFENRFEFSSIYLQLLMRSSFLMKQIRESSVGTTVATITMKNAVDFLIPVPPLGEQQRIVEKVDEIFGFLKGTAA